MKRTSRSLVYATFALLGLAIPQAAAQTRYEQAQKELARKVPAGTVQACSLITRADVKKATGREPYGEPEPAGQGGWICSVGLAELKVYSGPKSSEAWESTLKNFKKDKEPKTPAPGFGEGAYFMFLTPTSQSGSNSGLLVARSGTNTLVLSIDAPDGKPAESLRPALETLMKSALSRLP
jgi:hypothetical protein